MKTKEIRQVIEKYPLQEFARLPYATDTTYRRIRNLKEDSLQKGFWRFEEWENEEWVEFSEDYVPSSSLKICSIEEAEYRTQNTQLKRALRNGKKEKKDMKIQCLHLFFNELGIRTIYEDRIGFIIPGKSIEAFHDFMFVEGEQVWVPLPNNDPTLTDLLEERGHITAARRLRENSQKESM